MEEVLSPSGKVTYSTMPMYKQISADEIGGLKEYNPNGKGGIHSFQSLEDAETWMCNFCVGYTYVRPVVFLVEIPDGTETFEKRYSGNDTYTSMVNKSEYVKFIKPLKYMVNRKLYEYSPMVRPEKKRQSGGFVYDEAAITGDVDYVSE